VTDGDHNQVSAAALPAMRQPTATTALVEAHVGPTRQHPKADIVLWLCPPCALELTGPGQHQHPEKDQPR
jgi:hypothetical protein